MFAVALRGSGRGAEGGGRGGGCVPGDLLLRFLLYDVVAKVTSKIFVAVPGTFIVKISLQFSYCWQGH